LHGAQYGHVGVRRQVKRSSIDDINEPVNQPLIQFYDGKYLDGSVMGRSGTPYGPRFGLCLEPQNFPDAPNHSNFRKSRLEPGEIYTNRVVYEFGTR